MGGGTVMWVVAGCLWWSMKIEYRAGIARACRLASACFFLGPRAQQTKVAKHNAKWHAGQTVVCVCLCRYPLPLGRAHSHTNDPQNRGVTTEVNYDMGTFLDLADGRIFGCSE